MTLKYLRQYVTQKELAYEFEVGEATVHDTIVWIENTLVKDEKFKLPSKKVLLEDDSIEVILVDVTECPIERPKKTTSVVLGQEEKAENRRISRERILIENINAKFKVFKIMANKYRNRRKRHSLRTNLICGIINFEARI